MEYIIEIPEKVKFTFNGKVFVKDHKLVAYKNDPAYLEKHLLNIKRFEVDNPDIFDYEI